VTKSANAKSHISLLKSLKVIHRIEMRDDAAERERDSTLRRF